MRGDVHNALVRSNSDVGNGQLSKWWVRLRGQDNGIRVRTVVPK